MGLRNPYLYVLMIAVFAISSCNSTAPRIQRYRPVPPQARQPLPPSPFWQQFAEIRAARYGNSGVARYERNDIPRALRYPNRGNSTQSSSRSSSSTRRSSAPQPQRNQSRSEVASMSAPAPPVSNPNRSASSGPSAEPETPSSGGSRNQNSSMRSESPKKSPPSAPVLEELPFAIPIPGKDGYVTLPKGNSYRGEIDVRGIGSGTPVEIPDPSNPGNTVQFRVP